MNRAKGLFTGDHVEKGGCFLFCFLVLNVVFGFVVYPSRMRSSLSISSWLRSLSESESASAEKVFFF